MRRAEIDRKFDEIVDFAEIEKFLDTPVKRYSSGMYVRLAFAVAAHLSAPLAEQCLESEILPVNEVLAAGGGRHSVSEKMPIMVKWGYIYGRRASRLIAAEPVRTAGD